MPQVRQYVAEVRKEDDDKRQSFLSCIDAQMVVNGERMREGRYLITVERLPNEPPRRRK
jgi:hypothetical protein